MSASNALRIGRFELRPEQRQLCDNGRPVALGARAFDVLVALAAHRDRIVAKGELLDLAWPGLVVEENNLQVQISSLRKLLGARAIATVPGRGYRLVADAGEAAATASPAAAGEPSTLATEAPLRPQRRSGGGRLPPPPGPLVGRDDDLAALLAAMEGHRCCTVLGPGGIGKTRLALAAAERWRERVPDGVWWVDLSVLAPGSGAGAVAHALAAALALQVAAAGEDAAATKLADALQGLDTLIVLDNAEHVAAGCAELLAPLLDRAGALRLLVTSQAGLHLRLEHLHPLGTLALPAEGASLDEALASGALALLRLRARALNPRFEIDAASLPDAIEICRCLDGIALAIELAAACASWLGVQAVRQRLAQRLRLLAAPPHGDGARRQQTLRATLDWSHALLSADEQRVLRSLAVFVGGFDLGLAEALNGLVHGDDAWALLDLLGTLVDKCWVQVDGSASPRYRLLDSARLYALDQLEAAGEADRLRDGHAQALALRADLHYELYFRHPLDRWREALLPEVDNLCAALDTAIDRADADLAGRLYPACVYVLNQLDRVAEMVRRTRASAALLAALDPRRAVPVLSAQGVALALVAAGEAASAVQRALDLCAQGHGDAQFEHYLCAQRAQGLAMAGDVDGAAAFVARGRALQHGAWPALLRMALDSSEMLVQLFSLRTQAALDLGQAALASAEHLLADRAAAMLRANIIACGLQLGRHGDVVLQAGELLPQLMGPRWRAARAVTVCNLMHAHAELGNLAASHAVAVEGQPLMRSTGYLSPYLESVALLASLDGRFEVAALLVGQVQALAAAGHTQPDAVATTVRQAVLARLAAALGADGLAHAMARGAALDDTEVDALVRVPPPAGAAGERR